MRTVYYIHSPWRAKNNFCCFICVSYGPYTLLQNDSFFTFITERIEYKLLSLTYKVLTTTQPPYSHNHISVQCPCSTRSSSVVTLKFLPPSSSSQNNWSLFSLYFTLSLESAPFVSSSTSFWYQFLHFRLTYSFTHHFFLFWFTTLHIDNPPLSFTPGIKPACFTNPTPQFYFFLSDCLCRLLHGPFLLNYSVFYFALFFIPAKAREYVFTGVGLCGWFVFVCLSVTTITKILWTDLHQILCEGSYGEREDQVRVSLRSVEGCGSNRQKKSVNRRLFTK